jgi:DNA-binding NtrC family response regulator
VSTQIPPTAEFSHSPGAEPSSPLLAEFERFLRHAEERGSGEKLALRDWLELAEAWRIAQALRETGGNRSAAARALGIGRRTLYAKMDRLGIGPIWSVLPQAGGD